MIVLDRKFTFHIVNILNWHPLAIEQAAAIIGIGIIPIPNYAAEYNVNIYPSITGHCT
jgi:hypothetical protein